MRMAYSYQFAIYSAFNGFEYIRQYLVFIIYRHHQCDSIEFFPLCRASLYRCCTSYLLKYYKHFGRIKSVCVSMYGDSIIVCLVKKKVAVLAAPSQEKTSPMKRASENPIVAEIGFTRSWMLVARMGNQYRSYSFLFRLSMLLTVGIDCKCMWS